MKKISLCLVICILASVSVFAEDKKSKKTAVSSFKTEAEMWRTLKKEAKARFEGLELNPVFKTGFENDEFEYTARATLEIELPIFSKEKRIKRKKESTAFLEKGSLIIREIMENRKNIRIKKELVQLYAQVAKEEGEKAIVKLADIKEELIAVTEKEKEAVRNFDALVRPFGIF